MLFANVAALECTGRHFVFGRSEWCRLASVYGFIAILHAVGWGLFLHYASVYPAMVGLGLAAYTLGLRHAFDADHIAAVDDSARLLMQDRSQASRRWLFLFARAFNYRTAARGRHRCGHCQSQKPTAAVSRSGRPPRGGNLGSLSVGCGPHEPADPAGHRAALARDQNGDVTLMRN